jgi:uncharacterized membrane protein
MMLMIVIHLQVISIVLHKLGLSPQSATLLLFSSLFGSMINLPLFYLKNQPSSATMMSTILPLAQGRRTDSTLITLNVGGGLIPIVFSVFLMTQHQLLFQQILIATGLLTAISYVVSRPMTGLGIGMPVLLAPIAAATIALLINPVHAAPLAYISGTLGVLTGADLMRLRDIQKMGIPAASIGGAGTFDGIFLTGMIAVLLT